MIDSHCHIDFRDFDHDREEVIVQAAEFGVDRLINIGADIGSTRRSFTLADQYENIYCTVGIHPHDSKTLTDDFLHEMKTMTEHKKVVGIGEIGLDYYRDLSPRDIQKKAFIRQLDLAIELDLPVVIHVRDAMADALDIIKPYVGKVGGVFHCFPGTVEEARKVISMGFLVSVNGVMTYKNSKMAAIGEEIDLENILIETDAPYLTPIPHRGKRNVPAYVKHVCAKLAELRGIGFDEVEKITTRNTEKLFRLVEVFG
ncbi:MAG: TatD family hydrolase [FCB group bacterium]|nr:TatD family hydrolase [FCB group bacterium]